MVGRGIASAIAHLLGAASVPTDRAPAPAVRSQREGWRPGELARCRLSEDDALAEALDQVDGARPRLALIVEQRVDVEDDGVYF